MQFLYVMLSSAQSLALDVALMSPPINYTLPQLMERAGLAVAQAVFECFPNHRKILVVCGPGSKLIQFSQLNSFSRQWR